MCHNTPFITSISFVDFKTFTGSHTFDFSVSPGIYAITGNNEVSPRLGGNGVGKSSIMDALFWALTGSTIRGLRTPDIKPWQIKKPNTSVSVVFKAGNDEFTLTRETKPKNRLFITDDKGDQRDISDADVFELVGINREQLETVHVMPQADQRFLEMQPSQQQELFGKLVSLDKWLKRSKEASNEANSLEKQLRTLEGRYVALEEVLAGYNPSYLKNDSEAWESKHASDLKEAEKALEAAKADMNSIGDVKVYTNRLEAFENDLKKLDDEALEYEDELKSFKEELAETSIEIRNTEKLIAELQRENALASTNGECPYCGHSLSDAEYNDINDRFNAKLLRLQKKLVRLSDDEFYITEDIDSVTRDLDSVDADIAEIKNSEEYTELLNLINKGKILGNAFRKALKNSERSYSYISKQHNPYLSQLGKADDEHFFLGIDLLGVDEEIKKVSEDLEKAKFWAKAFKEIRLELMHQYLLNFEMIVNDVISAIGLEGWKVKFSVDGDKAKPSITTEILSTTNDKPVKFKSWSGGESARLSFAVQIGLINLVTDLTGYSPFFEFYDEPTTFMSDEGICSTVEVLKDRAQNEDKAIFLVDHHSLCDGNWTGEIQINKDSEGSFITTA